MTKARVGWLVAVSASWRRRSSSHRGEAGDAHESSASGPRLARVTIFAVLCSFAVVQDQRWPVREQASGTHVTFYVTVTIALLATTAIVTQAAVERWSCRLRLAALLVMGALTYLPTITLGWPWLYMAGYFAGSVVVLVFGRAGWALFAGVVGSLILLSAAWGSGLYESVYPASWCVISGLAISELGRIARFIRQSAARSRDLAEFEVMKERMRFARDLHDLLGYSLSVITLKTEFTRQLLIKNPGRACDELLEMADIARQAMADMHIAVDGYRSISLAKETDKISALLAMAGIRAHVDIRGKVHDENVDTVLATVVREAVTNVLRHSSARNCVIETVVADGTVRLRVSNDGVADIPAPERHGSGLRNLSARLATVGGRLTTEVHDDWFTVLAVAPLPPPTAERSASRR